MKKMKQKKPRLTPEDVLHDNIGPPHIEFIPELSNSDQ